MIWDINIRIFHWLLALLIILTIVSAKMDNLELHQYFGSSILGLLFFRIFWGFFGSHYSKFENFLYTTRETIMYLKGHETSKGGHNPLGSLSIFSFYILILSLTISGLFSSDDIMFDGILSPLTPKLTNIWRQVHNTIHYLIYFLICLHLLAIMFHQYVKKEEIINQMIDGKARKKIILYETERSHIFKGFIILLISVLLPTILIYFFSY